MTSEEVRYKFSNGKTVADTGVDFRSTETNPSLTTTDDDRVTTERCWCCLRG